MKFWIATALVFLVSGTAQAQAPWPGQCPAGVASTAIGCQPAAVTPSPTDLIQGWQVGQSPRSRPFQVQQLFTGAAPAAAFASPPSIGNILPNTGAFTTLSASGNATVGGSLQVGAGVSPPTGGISARGVIINPIAFPISGGFAAQVFSTSTAMSGIITGNGTNGWNSINVASDNLAMSGVSPALTDLQINHNFGGASWSGARVGMQINFLQTADINLGAGGGLAGAVGGIGAGVTLNHTFGGTGLTRSTAAGAGTAMNPYFVMASGYTNGGGGSGMEVDVSGRAGATFISKSGIAIVLDGVDAVQGVLNDTAFVFANQAIQGIGRGWKALISTGVFNGYFPVATDGAFWVIAPNATGDTLVVNKGLSWANGTFTTSAIETPGFVLDGSGNITSPSISNGSTGLTVGATGSKLGFYGATAIIKATPVGACAGNTGCQALRDALGNLGFIVTGSITN